MATLGTNTPTLYDWTKGRDPDGKAAKIAEILAQKNQMLEDMVMFEANGPTSHQVTIQTGLPTSYYRSMNELVPTSKDTNAQVTEKIAMLESWSEVDCALAELNGDVNSYRLQRAKAHIESMNQKQALTTIYGSAANANEYVGFANRYNDLSAGNADNIISAGGSSSDNTSAYLIGWGEGACYGTFPKGSNAGLMQIDHGKKTIQGNTDIGGSRMAVYQEQFCWKHGLVVEDWRYAVRIPNIDISDLQGLTGTQALTASTSIIKLMSRAIDRLPSLSSVKPAFYVNRTVASYLRIVALEKSSSAVTVQEGLNQFGQTIHELRFLGIPVRLVDQLTSAEAVVS